MIERRMITCKKIKSNPEVIMKENLFKKQFAALSTAQAIGRWVGSRVICTSKTPGAYCKKKAFCTTWTTTVQTHHFGRL